MSVLSGYRYVKIVCVGKNRTTVLEFQKDGKGCWYDLRYSDVAGNTISEQKLEQIIKFAKSRGCNVEVI